MKKLLSILSVLTISGTAVPTTIAASPYEKENNNNNLKKTTESNSNNKKEENNKITSRHRNKKTKRIKRIKRMWKIININQYIPSQMTVYIPRGFAVSNNPPDGVAIRKMASLRIKEQLGIDIPIYCINLNYLSRSGVTIKINYFDTINKITYSGIQYTVFTPIS